MTAEAVRANQKLIFPPAEELLKPSSGKACKHFLMYLRCDAGDSFITVISKSKLINNAVRGEGQA